MFAMMMPPVPCGLIDGIKTKAPAEESSSYA
jgi:hypothetical protein